MRGPAPIGEQWRAALQTQVRPLAGIVGPPGGILKGAMINVGRGALEHTPGESTDVEPGSSQAALHDCGIGLTLKGG